MLSFSYQVPNPVYLETKIPILDSRNKKVFELKKQRHGMLASIANETFRGGVPFCYGIADAQERFLFSLACAFPGIAYKINDHQTKQVLPITSRRVQLIEKAYSFSFRNGLVEIEKDHTDTAYVKRDGKLVAVVNMPVNMDVNSLDLINIQAEEPQIAALAAVLYHTFYYYGA